VLKKSENGKIKVCPLYFRTLRQGSGTATWSRKIAFFGIYKSVHSILDAAFRRLRQGADPATWR
jgi:hypothetical protein